MNWFETFFKYDPIVYERGTLAFQMLNSPGMFWLFAAVAGAGAFLLYRSIRNHASIGMIVLRSLTFVILLFILLQPVLNIATVLPQESYFAVVVDNSRSMQIADEGDGTARRADLLIDEMAATNFFGRLGEKFRVRTYRFDREAERIDDMSRMTFEGERTRVESATEMLFQELGTVPLSGVALISDGVDNASERFTESMSRLQSRGIPVFTVGVGNEAINRDVELIRAVTPRTSLKDATIAAEVSFRAHGLAGRPATIQVRENGILLKSEQVSLPRDGQIGEAEIDLPITNEGSRVFEFTVEAAEDRIPENNVLSTLVEVSNDRPKILYVDGEPRWDYKFIGRAMWEDASIDLVRLLRTSPNKYFRQGIETDTVLVDGFPTTREELFEYKGLILGSVESTFFTQEQQQMIVDFVSRRGGGLLMLGGRSSFSEGNYQNTVIADVLPVRLPAGTGNFTVENVSLEVSNTGRLHPIMQLNPNGNEPVVGWDELPPLTEYNRVAEPKPGAQVLANVGGASGNPVLLAYQRYGRGRSMVFTSSSGWRWQMQMPSEDQTHELFIRQLMRWVVNGSPDPVEARSENDSYVPGEQIRVFADISDPSFARMNNADVSGRIYDPDGNVVPLRFDWTGLEDGTYQATMTGSVSGIHTLEVEASYGGEAIGSYESTFQVRDRPVEFYNAALDTRFLESMAEQSGGRFYPLSELGDLPDDAQYIEGESSIIESRELWDVPILFLLLAMTLGGEWFWRKARGLA
jgi:uncharacterized membrane protein